MLWKTVYEFFGMPFPALGRLDWLANLLFGSWYAPLGVLTSPTYWVATMLLSFGTQKLLGNDKIVLADLVRLGIGMVLIFVTAWQISDLLFSAVAMLVIILPLLLGLHKARAWLRSVAARISFR